MLSLAPFYLMLNQCRAAKDLKRVSKEAQEAALRELHSGYIDLRKGNNVAG